MTEPLSAQELIARAEAAERAGAKEAPALWAALDARFPNHPRALLQRGWRQLQSGKPDEALRLLAQAEAGDPRHADAPLFAALAHRQQGDLAAAVAALDRALAIDPYFFMALMSKGSLLEQMGRPRQAARVYANAIKIAPAPERLPPQQLAGLRRAQDVVAQNAADLAAHLRQSTAALRSTFASEPLNRFDESLNILAGVQTRKVQDPILFYFPQLPAIPFYGREHFPWLEKLEAATEMIQAEMVELIRRDIEKFEPYMQLPPGAPVNQWVELNHSRAWSTVHLWRNGLRVDDICNACPGTAKLLDELPLAHQAGFGPNVVFSVLEPRTHIPPHTGSTNIRLLTHLPLVLPPDCRFRVGNETRPWQMNEAWVFDDTIEHEAWNDSDQRRVIMIFDVWNPLLSEAERALCSEMMRAMNDYNQG